MAFQRTWRVSRKLHIHFDSMWLRTNTKLWFYGDWRKPYGCESGACYMMGRPRQWWRLGPIAVELYE